MRSFVVALVALCTASVQAQPLHADGRGVYLAVGNAAPERVSLPHGADPSVVLGLRISDRLDVHAGFRTEFIDWSSFLRDEVGVVEGFRKSDAGALSLGYTVPAGVAVVVLRGSAVYQRREQQRVTYGPDSTDVWPLRSETRERVYTLVPVDVERIDGRFLHTGASLTVSLPLRPSASVQVAPGLGLSRTASDRLSGDAATPPGRWMSYLQVPVSVRLRNRMRVTLQAQVGVSRDRAGLEPQAFPEAAFFVDQTVRVNF